MNSSDFYRVKEDESKYNDICDIRKKANRTESDILEAFSGLQCPGSELHEWTSHSKAYKEKFKKAKQCIQRRLTTMKHFAAKSKANKTSRRKHIYPIQVAYTYAKDCAKKIGTKKYQREFEDSVDELIKDISKTQPDVQDYFGNSIEKSIRDKDMLAKILNRDYYNNEQTAIINKATERGYEDLDEENKIKYVSVFNKGFNKLVPTNTFEEENDRHYNIINEPTLKRDLQKFRRTKKKSKKTSINVSTPKNILKLNNYLGSNEFSVTFGDKRTELFKQVDKITELFKEKQMIQIKMSTLYNINNTAFKQVDKLNVNVFDILKKIEGSHLTKKILTKAGINEIFLDKNKAFQKRAKINVDLIKLFETLQQQSLKVNKKIEDIINSENTDIKTTLITFNNLYLPTYLLALVNKDINKMNNDEKTKALKEKDELFNIHNSIDSITIELHEIDKLISSNLAQQVKAKELLKIPALTKRTEQKLIELKLEEDILEQRGLQKYNDKTDLIYEMIQDVSKKYENLFVLRDILNKIVINEAADRLKN